jgi:hypothetical protein
MIKKLFLTACFGAFFSAFTMAQDVDQRLLVKYSDAELVDMKKSANDNYELLVYSLDHAMSITNYSPEKGGSQGTVEMPDLSKTYLELGYELKESENQIFQIGNTDKAVLILSRKVLEIQKR